MVKKLILSLNINKISTTQTDFGNWIESAPYFHLFRRLNYATERPSSGLRSLGAIKLDFFPSGGHEMEGRIAVATRKLLDGIQRNKFGIHFADGQRPRPETGPNYFLNGRSALRTT